MQIDEAGCYQPARSVDKLQRLLGGNIGLDGLDDPVANPDIAHGAQPLARVEDLATLDQQVELVVGAHRRADGRRQRLRRGQGTEVEQEAAAVDRVAHGGSSLGFCVDNPAPS
jgi:hypothetical protein